MVANARKPKAKQTGPTLFALPELNPNFKVKHTPPADPLNTLAVCDLRRIGIELRNAGLGTDDTAIYVMVRKLIREWDALRKQLDTYNMMQDRLVVAHLKRIEKGTTGSVSSNLVRDKRPYHEF